MEEVGFNIHPASNAYQNPWIAENRWYGKTQLFENRDDKLMSISFPPTNMLLVAEK